MATTITCNVVCALLEGRITELEAVCQGQKAMLDELATAAGFGLGDTYSAKEVIKRLSSNVG